MKKSLLVSVILILTLGLSGCINSSNRIIDDAGDGEIVQDEKRAEEALLSVFAYLNDQNYDSASQLLELEDETWEWLASFSLEEERSDKAKVLETYCEATGTCLKARIIETADEGAGVYNSVVQFENNDGSVFILGPCCGATEEEMPPQDKFSFKTIKINGTYKVATPPLYVP